MSTKETLKFKVRRMTSGDITGAIAVSDKLGDTGRISYRDMIASDVGGRADLSFVAESNGNIIGFIIAHLQYMGVPVSEVCLVHGIIIDPGYQRQGIGVGLVNELLDYCRLEEINPIRLLLAGDNRRNIDFFQRFGFARSKLFIYDRNFES
jgi:ribosomal protein S18 acetylase RimI-like enzyme